MAAAEQWGRDNGCTEMVLITGNPSAIKFYLSIGYHEIGRTDALLLQEWKDGMPTPLCKVLLATMAATGQVTVRPFEPADGLTAAQI